MSHISIYIDVDNDAFAIDPGNEVSRILRDLAAQVEWESLQALVRQNIKVRDSNGNTVGTFDVHLDHEIERESRHTVEDDFVETMKTNHIKVMLRTYDVPFRHDEQRHHLKQKMVALINQENLNLNDITEIFKDEL